MKDRQTLSAALLNIGKATLQIVATVALLIAIAYVVISNPSAFGKGGDPWPTSTPAPPTATPTPVAPFHPIEPDPTPTPTPVPPTSTPIPPTDTPVPPTYTPTPIPTPLPPSPIPTDTPVPSTPTPLPTPPAVTGVSVTAATPFGTTKRANVQWTFIPDAPTYKVERRIGSGGSWGSVSPLTGGHGPEGRTPRTWGDVYPASCAATNYFRVSAYGNGIRYRHAYGPPSSTKSISTTALACTPTPTPEPEPCGSCPTPTPLELSDPRDKAFPEDQAITAFTLPAATGGNTPYTYSVSGLPTGLSFNTSSRRVSGTPTVAGESTVTYTVTDSASPTAATKSQTFTITVNTTPPPPNDKPIPPGKTEHPHPHPLHTDATVTDSASTGHDAGHPNG